MNAMRIWPRTRLGVFLAALLVIALSAQGASAAVMNTMMAQTGMSSSQDKPCGTCDGNAGSPAFQCAVPCLAGPAILLSATVVESSGATFPVSLPIVTATEHLQAPDPNPPQP